MLRDIMAVSDVYQYADLIMEMLREDYGSYDADSLDEVLVEETFAQRLASRGYEVRPWGEGAAGDSAPAATPTPAPAPAPATQSGEVVPVTIVRSRRTAGSGERSTGAPQQRARRTAPSGDTARPAAGGDSATRPKAEGTRGRPSSDSGGPGASAPRQRRAPRTPRSNGDSEA
jgi:hypothetical protein